ncbi:MAG TPA: DNA alkylation repair protein [Nocardioidaceae bacterium]|nr:DNA alkylation repair protein [Nocardioidaceae bacterium]
MPASGPGRVGGRVLDLWHTAGFREERYAAIELTGHQLYRAYQDARALDLYRHLVVTGAWWDYVDGVACARVGPILRADPDRVDPVVRAWALDDDLWLRRTAILCQLGGKTDPDWVLAFVQRHPDDLAPLSRREALKNL